MLKFPKKAHDLSKVPQWPLAESALYPSWKQSKCGIIKGWSISQTCQIQQTCHSKLIRNTITEYHCFLSQELRKLNVHREAAIPSSVSPRCLTSSPCWNWLWVSSPANGFPVSMTINGFPTGKPWRETKNKNQNPTTELRHRVFIWVSSWEMMVRRLLFSLMLELETLPLSALLLWAHGMMWSSHMLISKKFYRLPHSILEPFSNKLSVGIGCKSSWRYFCSPPAHLLGNVIVLGHVLSQPCWGVRPWEWVELGKCTWILLHTHK